jgi:hypothetical protein
VGSAKLAVDRAHAVAGHDGHFRIRQPGDLQREQTSLAWRQRGDARERNPRLKQSVQARARVRDTVGPNDCTGRDGCVEPSVAALDARQPERLVDRDVRNHPNTRSRSGWRRNRINHAVWQASSISSRDAFTERPTERTSARW